jgi:O-antigen/teichoic acid export membrane protein
LPHLFIVVLAAFATPYVRTAVSLGVVRSRVRQNAELGVLTLVVFGVAMLILVPVMGALGAAIAVVAGSSSAAVLAVWQMSGTGVLAIARTARQLVASVIPVVLVLAGGVNQLVALASLPLYLALLFGLRIVSPSELWGLAGSVVRGGGRRPE